MGDCRENNTRQTKRVKWQNENGEVELERSEQGTDALSRVAVHAIQACLSAFPFLGSCRSDFDLVYELYGSSLTMVSKER